MKVLVETLTPDQRKSVGKWKKGKHSFSDHVFGGPMKTGRSVSSGQNHTIFIPLSSDKKSTHQKAVERHVGKLGFQVHDYPAGLAKDKHGRDVRIGKILSKSGNHKLLAKFNADPTRGEKAAHKDHVVAISRHPHHVAGMTSCDHPWADNSCMNIRSGANARRLPDEVEHGTHVAYLVHKDDKEIKKPIGRIALKPYAAGSYHHPTNKILRPDPEVFGNAPSSFHNTVKQWANKHFKANPNKLYRIRPVYQNQSPATIEGSGHAWRRLSDQHNPKYSNLFSAYPHLSDRVVHKLADHPDHDFKIAAQAHVSVRTAKKLIRHDPGLAVEVAHNPKSHHRAVLHALMSSDRRITLPYDRIREFSKHDMRKLVGKGSPLEDHIKKMVALASPNSPVAVSKHYMGSPTAYRHVTQYSVSHIHPKHFHPDNFDVDGADALLRTYQNKPKHALYVARRAVRHNKDNIHTPAIIDALPKRDVSKHVMDFFKGHEAKMYNYKAISLARRALVTGKLNKAAATKVLTHKDPHVVDQMVRELYRPGYRRNVVTPLSDPTHYKKKTATVVGVIRQFKPHEWARIARKIHHNMTAANKASMTPTSNVDTANTFLAQVKHTPRDVIDKIAATGVVPLANKRQAHFQKLDARKLAQRQPPTV